MGVAVLNPQDCLQNPLSSRQDLISPPPQMKTPRNANSNRPNRAQPSRRKRSPNTSPSSRAAVAPQVTAKNLVMGQVKILKRGEQLAKPTPEKVSQPAKVEKMEDLDLGSTHRLGPDPELVPTQIRLTETNKVNGFYAGSAFITSPPPSSLPLPAFFMKKCAVGVKNTDATTDLRRILGLNL
ncbi:uncharacterized protein LOC110604139 [Manihot esculenta]|uniref:Uncharacterized protein n=1 Tax=Manihot esculenta TaxID=3983 RepID=A0A2C9UB83_MANES|nr:uncharacterized protein LOC110604139 [Manihot esculenta]OAY27452.1 hypothetical protein MANES_16G126400v8 [Manihot esculenta]